MARRNALIAGLVVAVLLGHGLALQWLTRQAQAQAAIRLMVTPMFTRVLQAEAPPPPPKADSASGRTRSRPGVIQSIAPSTPSAATSTAAAPEPLVPPPAEPAQATATAPTASESVVPPPAAEPAVTATTTAPEVTPTSSETAATAATPTAAVTGNTAGLDSWPADTRLNYRVGGFFRGELHGSARVQWQRDGDRYQTRIDIDLGVVSLVMTSQGEVTPQALVPRAYEETRAGRRRSATLHERRIVLSNGTEVPRPEGVQDTASQFVELSHRFASGQLALEVGRSISFPMARPGGVDQWTYDVVGKEVLQTPQLGAVEAFHLKPRPLTNPRGNITAEMWFAPSLQYLPVRIRVVSGEASLDLFVEKIEQR